MKNIIFDTSTLISLSTNNLLWTLRPLKKRFKGEFYITRSVKEEIVDKPLKTKRFKLNALMLKDLIGEGILTIYDSKELRDLAEKKLKGSNTIYSAHNNNIKIIHLAEMEALVLYSLVDSSALAMDERTLRLLVESPEGLKKVLTSRLHTKVEFNHAAAQEFQKEFAKVNIIRSTELMTIAYDLKILDKFITDKVLHKDLRKELLDGVLWGLKLNGAAISPGEIRQILKVHGY